MSPGSIRAGAFSIQTAPRRGQLACRVGCAVAVLLIPDLHFGSAETVCTCGTTFTVDTTALRDLIEQGKQLIARDEKSALGMSFSTTLTIGKSDSAEVSKLIESLSALVPDSCYPLLPLLHLNAVVLLPPWNPEQKATATIFLDRAIRAASGAYPPNHPAVALWTAEWARLVSLVDSHDMRAKPAGFKALDKAITACNAAFGEGGEIAEALKKEMSGLEMMLSQMSMGV